MMMMPFICRGCGLWRPLHARGDKYQREEGHVTPATLTISLSLRNNTLRDQATRESASAATRQKGCGSAGMRTLAPTAFRAATRQTRRGNAGSGTRMISPNSRGPTLIEGVRADGVDALGPSEIQRPRKPGAGAGADERRPCSNTRRTQSLSPSLRSIDARWCAPPTSVVNVPAPSPSYLQQTWPDPGASFKRAETSPSHAQTVQGSAWTCCKANRSTSVRT